MKLIDDLDPYAVRARAGDINAYIHLQMWVEGIVSGYLEVIDAMHGVHQWIAWLHIDMHYLDALDAAIEDPRKVWAMINKELERAGIHS